MRLDKLDILINLGRTLVVTFETDVGKLGIAAQARFDIGNADVFVCQFGAQVHAELAHKSLGRTIDITAGISITAGNRTQIDDVALFARDHLRQNLTGQKSQADDIGLNHGCPIAKIGFIGSIQTQSQTGVVDQAIDFGQMLGQAVQSVLN